MIHKKLISIKVRKWKNTFVKRARSGLLPPQFSGLTKTENSEFNDLWYSIDAVPFVIIPRIYPLLCKSCINSFAYGINVVYL